MSRVAEIAARVVAPAVLLLALAGCPGKGAGGAGNLASCLDACRSQLAERIREMTSKGQMPGLAEERLEEECKAACRDKHPG